MRSWLRRVVAQVVAQVVAWAFNEMVCPTCYQIMPRASICVTCAKYLHGRGPE